MAQRSDNSCQLADCKVKTPVASRLLRWAASFTVMFRNCVCEIGELLFFFSLGPMIDREKVILLGVNNFESTKYNYVQETCFST